MEIDTEVVGDYFMDMRLGYCRQIAEAAAGRYHPLSYLGPEALWSIVEEEQHSLLERDN